MNKMLLKRLLFELLEDLIHVDSQIQTLEYTLSTSALAYLKALKNALSKTIQDVWGYHSQFIALYQDAPLDEKFAETCLNQIFPTIRKDINRLSNSIYRLRRTQMIPETELFLSSMHLDKLLPDSPELTILPSQNQSDREGLVSTESLLLEFLPVLAFENPLRWMGLLETFSRHFCEKTLQIGSFLENLDIPEPKADVIVPLLNLRILGPGYYAYYTLNAFNQSDATALWAVEPILFQELNRFGFVNKDLVILHQSVERGRQNRNMEEPKAITRVLNRDEMRDELLMMIEKIIPSKLAFTEKSFMRTQLLEERLDNGVMISAIPMLSSQAQLREDLESIMGEEKPIYPLLKQLGESAATPREIINAGWLYKLDQSSDWLQTALEAGTQDGWESLKSAVLGLDTLILKSIEIAEVHRVLSLEETEHLVPA